MKLIHRHNILPSARMRWVRRKIILHHTVTPTVESAEDVLANRGLSYHYIIAKDGIVYEYVPPNRRAFHAKGHNFGTIGISFVGGGKFGPVNTRQVEALVQLTKILKSDYKLLAKITGHKHASKSGKVDPHFPGEPQTDVNWEIDYKYMIDIGIRTGLEPVFTRGPHKGK